MDSYTSLARDEADRYRDPGLPRRPSTTVGTSNTTASNGYHRYSMGESGNGSGSDTTALQSNQHVTRTNSFGKNRRSSDSGQQQQQQVTGFDPDRLLQEDSEGDHDFSYDPHHDRSNRVPLVSYKTKNKRNSGVRSGNKLRSTQPQRQGEYGRISNDSFHSGYSQDHGGSEEDEDDLDFGQEEEGVGMMTGNRSNRSGIGNHGRDYDETDAKLPDHGGSLFDSFLNMANSIIGAGTRSQYALFVPCGNEAM